MNECKQYECGTGAPLEKNLFAVEGRSLRDAMAARHLAIKTSSHSAHVIGELGKTKSAIAQRAGRFRTKAPQAGQLNSHTCNLALHC